MKEPIVSRRQVLGAFALAALPLNERWFFAPNSYEGAAKEAVRWIRAQALTTGAGKAWPAIAGKKETLSPDLYSGTAGVALLLAEAGRRWKDPTLIDEARQGAKDVQSWGPQLYDQRFLGLYTGLAGAIWAISRVEEAGARDSTWREDPNLDLRLVYANDLVKHRAHSDTNDVISGLAGIGLALLENPLGKSKEQSLAMACAIGDELVARAKPEPEGSRWPLSDGYARNMPNFSHGTAGVAFFLAKLYSRTRKKAYLEAAVKGGEYLLSIADKSGDGCLIFHVDPDGLTRYYLGWCHGPAGTSQLWWQLAKSSGDKKWSEWAVKSARSLVSIGVPQNRSDGYWNNEGLCCGTAGIGRFFLDTYRRTNEKQFLASAEACAIAVIEKAVKDEQGMRWSFAEHRVKPEEWLPKRDGCRERRGLPRFCSKCRVPEERSFACPSMRIRGGKEAFGKVTLPNASLGL